MKCFGKKATEVKCHSRHIVEGYLPSGCTRTKYKGFCCPCDFSLLVLMSAQVAWLPGARLVRSLHSWVTTISDPFLYCTLWREVTACSPYLRCRKLYSAPEEQNICVNYLEFCSAELPIFSCFLTYLCGLIDTYFHAPVLGSAISPQSRTMFNLVWKTVFSTRKTSEFEVEKNWLTCCSLHDCEEYIFVVPGLCCLFTK